MKITDPGGSVRGNGPRSLWLPLTIWTSCEGSAQLAQSVFFSLIAELLIMKGCHWSMFCSLLEVLLHIAHPWIICLKCLPGKYFKWIPECPYLNCLPFCITGSSLLALWVTLEPRSQLLSQKNPTFIFSVLARNLFFSKCLCPLWFGNEDLNGNIFSLSNVVCFIRADK